MRIIDARVRLPEHLRPATVAPHDGYHSRYNTVLATEATRSKSMADLAADMAGAAVEAVVLHAEYEYGDVAGSLNEAVAKAVSDNSHVLAGIGTVTMADTPPMRRVQEVREVAAFGLPGINIQPSFFGLPIDDRSLYPMYAKAAEEGLTVFVHTGVNYTAHRPIRNDNPLQLDQVACDFPGMPLVACHAGWPFAAEMVAVARKHEAVHLDFGGLAPRYVGRPGTGWDAIFGVMNSLLVRQVLFATDWPVFPMARAVSEWLDLGLRAATLTALFSGNLLRLLDVGGVPA